MSDKIFVLKSIEWLGDRVRFIDQSKLPAEEIYVETDDLQTLAEAILRLKIRGAPALGVAAAYGVLLGIRPSIPAPRQHFTRRFEETVAVLSRTRPTAKNLFWALERMQAQFRLNTVLNNQSLFDTLEAEALSIHREDEAMCKAIGEHGSALIPAEASILTHCNTGALATGGIGTAQAVITTAYGQKKSIRVYADETRPLLQGARLTVWELMKHGIDVTLITDNAAAWVMRTKKIDVVLAGADRIAANGDTANKVGTYGLAILAAEHRIPMYIAAPTSTIDMNVPDGNSIPIEERPVEEVTDGFGRRTAPDGTKVYSPAFDVTPNKLINAIITEKGIIYPPYRDSIAQLFGLGNGVRA